MCGKISDAEITESVTELLSRMIRFRSTDTRPDQLQELADFVADYFRDVHVFVKRFSFGEKPALVITTRQTKQPRLFFQGHLDVVDGNDEQFRPRIEDNRLYGRGAVDMKGFDAIALHLLRCKALEGTALDFGIMLTSDEEIGSENGAKKLAEMGYNCQILLNGDGGYNHALIYAEKGILKFKLRAKATPGRHPYPWQGGNAFDKLIQNYNRIVALFPNQTVATDDDNWYTTFSTYDVHVENDPLFPPKLAELKMNVYFTEPYTSDEYFQRIRGVLDADIEMEPLTASERVFLNPNNTYFRQFQEILSRHFGRPIPAKAENGSSDARFFANRGPTILIVKVVGEGHHTPAEFIQIPSIAPLYRAIEEFSESVARPLRKEKMEEAFHESSN